MEKTPAPSKRELAPRRTDETRTEFDRLFDELWNRTTANFGLVPFGPLGRLSLPPTAERPYLRTAPTDVVDTGKTYRILAEVPGIHKQDIDIRIRGNSVEIKGETAAEERKESEGYLHRERSYAGYYRAFELPGPVVASEAKAQVENGVLRLELPKQHPSPAPAETQIRIE